MSKIKQILIPTVSLFIICAVITAALAVTDFVTKAPIEKATADALSAMLKSSVEDADEFSKQDGDTVYYEAKKGGDTLAYVFETVAKGYGGDVTVLTAISLDGKVMNVTVSDASNETTGIGSKVKTDEVFLAQFKDSTDEITDFDAVTGATYSSKGVKNAVNKAIEAFKGMEAAK